MRKVNILTSLVLALSLPVLALASVAMDGTTTNAQYVYTESNSSDGVEVVDYSDAAEDNDGDLVEFYTGDEDEQTLYIGMEVPFDKIKLELTGSVEYEDDADLDWEYYTGSVWKNLTVSTTSFDDFITVDTETITFDIPSSWDNGDFEFDDNTTVAEDAYWIRVSADEVVEGGSLDQISVTAYLLEVTVENEDGSRIINLSDENFMISGGSDNEVYGVLAKGNGRYLLAVNTSSSNTDYRFTVTVGGYDQLATDLVMDGDNEVELDIVVLRDHNCYPDYSDIDYHWAQSAIRELYCRSILQISTDDFRPNTRVSRAEFLKMALNNAGVDTSIYTYKENPFDDVDREDDWYAEYALAAYNLDVIDGDNDFNADYSLNRAEAVVILIRLAGIEADNSTTPFYDIASTDWFAASVRAAADMNVVEGYPDGSFQGERYLSRAESAVMVNNMYYAQYE
ncbi:MAG: hypothetical protein ACI9QC_000751 [Oceanicoccus sp.]|jgi:hypothetical protein